MTSPQPLNTHRPRTSLDLVLHAENKSPGTTKLYNLTGRQLTDSLDRHRCGQSGLNSTSSERCGFPALWRCADYETPSSSGPMAEPYSHFKYTTFGPTTRSKIRGASSGRVRGALGEPRQLVPGGHCTIRSGCITDPTRHSLIFIRYHIRQPKERRDIAPAKRDFIE